jgi:hypothetical protein
MKTCGFSFYFTYCFCMIFVLVDENYIGLEHGMLLLTLCLVFCLFWVSFYHWLNNLTAVHQY